MEKDAGNVKKPFRIYVKNTAEFFSYGHAINILYYTKNSYSALYYVYYTIQTML